MRSSPRRRRREHSEEAARPLPRTLSRVQLDAWRTRFMGDVIGPAIRDPARRALVQRHRDAGDPCCTVAAANVLVTAPIGKALGFDRLLGIELGAEGDDPHARYTGNAVGVPTFREGKIARIEPSAGSRRSAIACRTWNSRSAANASCDQTGASRTWAIARPGPPRRRLARSAQVDLRCPACCSNSRRTIRTMPTTMQTNTNHSAST
ncbi:haloacid dehalogenase-like hydrolase [Burkholderia sp. BDU5]|uniref:HAD family hydrolase n=1 Tax=Burkholderia sp. BDU5 TaxID=1385590 RepID=UPI001E60C784|nr:haloacid dehalogenase-like hydrolase [Burkholderia sp. BDU5]